MLLPVIERFAELGWRAFVEPGETYELFSVSGIFKRVHVDTTAGDSSSADAAQQQIAQRHALFDVCLGSGLAHLIVAYVCASESDTSSSSSVNHDGKRYVLKEPVAVQQWLRRRVDGLEKTVHADVSALAHARDGLDATSAASTPTDHHHHNRMHRKGTHKTSDVESFMRELSGLRAVAMALVERLQESAHQLEANALALRSLPPSMASQRREDLLQQTELARLTNEGIQQLLELLFRAQAATLTCQCLLWFKEHHVVFDADQYHEFYYQARSARASLRQSFEGSYDVVLSSVSNSDIAFPSLLIEMVHQNASVADQLSLPPGGVSDLFSLLQAPVVPAEMVQSFAREIRLAPVESFFRVQTALLLYFALDLAYVSLTQRPSHQHHAWMGQELVDHFVDIAASFAAQLGVPDDMAATLLAIWLIENAVNIKLSSNEEVGPIYQGAVTRLLESSAMHLQHKGAGLEPELILYMVETLVHRGESSIAWKIWTAFDMDLAKLPPVATEYTVMVNLELTAWERALSLLREQRRLDLLPLVLKWLVKNNRMKELVHYATLTAQEEELFDEFMMGGRVLGEDVLLEMSIRKADLLVMYYVLRNHFDRAWAVHHEHLAQIRESTSGHTSVAHAVLHQQSFRIRTALLQTMKPEPTLQEPTYNFKRSMQVTRPVDTDVMMIGSSSNLPLLQLPEMSASEDERMSDEFTMASSMPLPLPPPAPAESTPLRRRETTVSDASPASSPAPTSFTYSPGIFSSRSSQPRSASSSMGGEATPAAAQSTSRRNVLTGSIDSSPATASSSTGPLRRHSDDASSAKRVAQTLNFGLSPVVPHGNTSGNPTPSSEHGKASSDQPRALVLQPVRSPFNSAFSTLPSMPSASSSGSEDLSLRPRSESAANPAPVDVQVGSSSGLAPAAAKATDGSPLPSTIATTASTATQDLTLFATPKRFQFVREPPKTDSRVVVGNRSHDAAALRSPATQELEAMELEPIDEEFSTPAARSGRGQALARKEPQSVPTRRNPRRNTRSLY